MQRVNTSFKTFRAPIRCARSVPFKQQISTRGNWLVRGSLQKCLECKGIPRISLRGNGKLSGFYPVNKPYPHKPNCSNAK